MRRVLLAVFSTIAGLVMLLSFKTEAIGTSALPAAVGTSGPVDPTTPDATSSAAPSASLTTGSGATSNGSTSTSSAPTAASSAAAAGTSGTYTGTAADTRYGPVQVQITVTDGRVTAAQAVDYPTNNGRDQEINARAVPQLNAEATQAGTANIDTVSGATYTSDGYIQSLQSALDQAGL